MGYSVFCDPIPNQLFAKEIMHIHQPGQPLSLCLALMNGDIIKKRGSIQNGNGLNGDSSSRGLS